MKTFSRINLIIFAFSVALLTQVQLHAAAPADDCECEKIECGVCEKQADIKFYTDKCAGGNRVKSCQRPLCEKVEKFEVCLAEQKNKAKTMTVENQDKGKNRIAELEVKETDKKIRMASGVVVVAQGTSWISHDGEKPVMAKVGEKVYEKDMIETGGQGKVKVLFKDKNTVNVTPDSKMQIAEVVMVGGPEDRTLLDLVYGKIRSKVNKKYDGSQNNYYRVRTKAAVAGVRGTDFVVSFFEQAGFETKVETLSGTVAMAARKKIEDKGEALESNNPKEKIDISKGTYAKFVIDKNDVTDVFSNDDIQSFVAKGYMTPVYQLSEKELKILDRDTDFQAGEKDRKVASDSSPVGEVCGSPKAVYNECVWTCNGNPKGEKTCRTDLPHVNCVRKRCNANGKWAEETRLPASFNDYCEADKAVVKACDY